MGRRPPDFWGTRFSLATPGLGWEAQDSAPILEMLLALDGIDGLLVIEGEKDDPMHNITIRGPLVSNH
jgi:hypothetical protein